jgi:hypothetical protein
MPSDTFRLRACVGRKSIDASPVIPNLSFSCELGVAEERLRGDAPHVQAHTAPVLRLHDSHALAQLRGADGSDVPTGSGTEDDDVEVLAHASEPRG